MIQPMISKISEADLCPYKIQIDVEGYPVSDEGMRLDDGDLLKPMFQNLRRINPQLRGSALITCIDKQWARVQAFDAPLVAQSVEFLNAKLTRWNFLGGLSIEVALQEIEVDEWQRLHAFVGSWKIPALLSHKAQASFLHQLENMSFNPRPFRSSENPVETENFWNQAYLQSEDKWELNAPSPVLQNHFPAIPSSLFKTGPLLVPGCGRGHDAEFLELQKKWLSVSAVDFSHEALHQYKTTYPQSRVKLIEEDILSFLKTQKSYWAGIFEHTLFCAISPKLRKTYIERVHNSLQRDGILFGIFFLKTNAGGPPFGLTQYELKEYVSPLFEIHEWQISSYSVLDRKDEELWVTLKKK